MFQAEHRALIWRIVSPDLNFDCLTDDDYCFIEEKIGDHYNELCQDNGSDTEIALCEEILDLLSKI